MMYHRGGLKLHTDFYEDWLQDEAIMNVDTMLWMVSAGYTYEHSLYTLNYPH